MAQSRENVRNLRLQAALDLLRKGFAVVPCDLETGAPLVADLDGLRVTLPTEAQLEDWWRQWPDAEPHVVLGSGLVKVAVGERREPAGLTDEERRLMREIAESVNALCTDQQTGGPEINAGLQNLEVVTRQAIDALCMANQPEPRIFLRGGIPVRVEPDDDGLLVAKEMTVDRLRHTLARVARWYVVKQVKGEPTRVDAKPPVDVCRDVLASPTLPFPILTSIVHAPVFAPDGTFQTAPGYHAASRTYLALAPGFSVPEVPETPGEGDVNRAKDLVFRELLCDFPFVSDADRAHAAALLLLPFVRAMIQGPTPLHIIEASSPGSGKGLLADVLLYPAVGRAVGIIPPPRDDEELRKGITGRLRDGASVILFDNVTSLTSPVLSAVLTATWWDDRVLGKSETIRLPVRCAWVATANNGTLSTDVARRSIRIRLDPKTDRPWLRTGFRHPDLRSWVAAHRGELVWAAAVLVRAWVTAGKPCPSCGLLGSFESWTRVVGGILQNAGIPGFLANALEFYEAADAEAAAWRQFIALWWERFGDKPVAAADLFPLALELDSLDLGKGTTERSLRVAFGKKLARQRDRIIDGYRVEFVGTSKRAALWRLTKAEVVNIASDIHHEEDQHTGQILQAGVNVGECFDLTATRARIVKNGTNSVCGATEKHSPYSPYSPEDLPWLEEETP